mmetsp:Transcript_32161/g.46373  ORF Transcript_32161/g.46373 Transcript_32161/m.46373 type:complete len:96 (+) Transcript_32161:500-787(+)
MKATFIFTRYDVPEFPVGDLVGLEDVEDLADGTEVSNFEGLEVDIFKLGTCDGSLLVGLGVGFIVGLSEDGRHEGWIVGLKVGNNVGLRVGFTVG